jgi:hypothetical protein
MPKFKMLLCSLLFLIPICFAIAKNICTVTPYIYYYDLNNNVQLDLYSTRLSFQVPKISKLSVKRVASSVRYFRMYRKKLMQAFSKSILVS